MKFSSIATTLSAAALAAAAPAAQYADSEPQTFAVTNFIFGCTSGCYWNFDVAVKDKTVPVHCSGSLTQADYVQCSSNGLGSGENIAAYIAVTNKDTLKLKYLIANSAQGTSTSYFGEAEVYSATGENGSKQQSSFDVPVSQSAGVA